MENYNSEKNNLRTIVTYQKTVRHTIKPRKMKKLVLSLITLFALTTLVAQEGQDSLAAKKDTSYTIKWGDKTIIVIDHGDGDIDIATDDTIKIESKPSQRYNHYAGIDLGVNGLLNSKNSVNLGEDEKFMDQHYWGSWSVSLNFIDSYIPIAKEKFGITIGMGFEFNKFSLSRDFTVANFQDSTIGIPDSNGFEKNLFKMEMINLPIMFETNIGKDAAHSFHLAVGGMVSYTLGSKTKQVFELDGEEIKTKVREDFNTNPFRFSLMGRIGYGNFTLFATYSLTPLFEEDRGPELYPFTVGVSLVHF
ncbi:MAG: hypothetical protein CMP59_03800 [Flavobacteriales bacterium]|nr:hypothetical protein [Flavobacteriales bacterium]